MMTSGKMGAPMACCTGVTGPICPLRAVVIAGVCPPIRSGKIQIIQGSKALAAL